MGAQALRLKSRIVSEGIGGARRNRTDDLLHAMQALSQLSYGPTSVDRAPGHATRPRFGSALLILQTPADQAEKSARLSGTWRAALSGVDRLVGRQDRQHGLLGLGLTQGRADALLAEDTGDPGQRPQMIGAGVGGR